MNSRDYEVIATLGPASRDETIWDGLLDAGVTGFRLNTSHLSLEELEEWLERIYTFFTEQNVLCPVILDLQGSKWRLGKFFPFYLTAGERVFLRHSQVSDQEKELPVPHHDFFRAAPLSSGEIILNDAKIVLQIERYDPDYIAAQVVQGGEISSNKGITFASTQFRQEDISQKDHEIFSKSRNLNFVRYAISYVRDAIEMSHYRHVFGPNVYLVAKLERQSAMEEAFQIAGIADELWVCRGDLGAELGIPAMAQAVHNISKNVFHFPKPVFMAGQVLELMKNETTPTRSEVCYLFDILMAGYHGVVLSDETAIGINAIHACKTAGMFRKSGDGGN